MVKIISKVIIYHNSDHVSKDKSNDHSNADNGKDNIKMITLAIDIIDQVKTKVIDKVLIISSDDGKL